LIFIFISFVKVNNFFTDLTLLLYSTLRATALQESMYNGCDLLSKPEKFRMRFFCQYDKDNVE